MQRLQFTIIILLLALLGYFVVENRNNTQLAEPMRRDTPRTGGGKAQEKGEDPYLAAQVKNSLTKAAADLQTCYLAYLKERPEKTAGAVKMDWLIEADGSVEQAAVVTSEFEDLKFHNCLIEKISEIRFPPPADAPKYVAHTLAFKDQAALEADRKARDQGPLIMLDKQQNKPKNQK